MRTFWRVLNTLVLRNERHHLFYIIILVLTEVCSFVFFDYLTFINGLPIGLIKIIRLLFKRGYIMMEVVVHKTKVFGSIEFIKLRLL